VVKLSNPAGGIISITIPESAATANENLTFTIPSNVFMPGTYAGPSYELQVVTPGGTSNGVNFMLNSPVTPAITSIAPSEGTMGTSVTIYGYNLTGASMVNFFGPNNNIVGSITIPESASTASENLTFTLSPAFNLANLVPGTRYEMDVVTPGGASNWEPFTLANLSTASTGKPVLSSVTQSLTSTVTPTITLYGQNLGGVTTIQFINTNGTVIAFISDLSYISSDSSEYVNFRIPPPIVNVLLPGTTYTITVITAGGKSNGVGFIPGDNTVPPTTTTPPTSVTDNPIISSISPDQGDGGTTVTIYGQNLAGTRTVNLVNSNGNIVGSIAIPDSISANAVGSLMFTIPTTFNSPALPFVLGTTYQMEVVTPGGTSNEQSFIFTNATTTAYAVWGYNGPQPVDSLVPITSSTPMINITGPVAGQNITEGATTFIQWTSTGVNNVNVYLCASSGSCSFLSGGDNADASSGSLSWFVDPSNNWFPGSDFQIKVVDAASSSIAAYSGSFDVVTAASTPGTASSSSTQALRMQLDQLIVLLLQLIQQASQQGLISTAQLNSFLGAVQLPQTTQ
jgi:hypothetical protein